MYNLFFSKINSFCKIFILIEMFMLLIFTCKLSIIILNYNKIKIVYIFFIIINFLYHKAIRKLWNVILRILYLLQFIANLYLFFIFWAKRSVWVPSLVLQWYASFYFFFFLRSVNTITGRRFAQLFYIKKVISSSKLGLIRTFKRLFFKICLTFLIN